MRLFPTALATMLFMLLLMLKGSPLLEACLLLVNYSFFLVTPPPQVGGLVSCRFRPYGLLHSRLGTPKAGMKTGKQSM